MLKWALMVGLAGAPGMENTGLLLEREGDCQRAARVIEQQATKAAQGGQHLKAECRQVETIKINPDGTVEPADS
ncbi:hypothetical protein [Pseudomonas pseudonitroreducens]|uniref:hypothetical protein n=1 Tax=Pseudomonas pseudonitroreducens TaxID=2892326 RepID=UPI001F163DAF|nr:hypothetical protein [Pseudomonas pseudonitroreducens]